MSKPNYIVHKVKMPDTGIGQVMGYKDDDDFRRAVDEERKKLPVEVQEAIKEHERRAMNVVLYGNPEGAMPPEFEAYYGEDK